MPTCHRSRMRLLSASRQHLRKVPACLDNRASHEIRRCIIPLRGLQIKGSNVPENSIAAATMRLGVGGQLPAKLLCDKMVSVPELCDSWIPDP